MEDEWIHDIGCGVKYFSQDSVIKLAPGRASSWTRACPPAEKLKVVQARMAEDDPAAADIYTSIGTYLGHALAYYYELYQCKHVLLLGRVMTGKGGDIILAEAKRVLADEYPELEGKDLPPCPTEKFRRVGQSAAAASLPEIKKRGRPEMRITNAKVFWKGSFVQGGVEFGGKIISMLTPRSPAPPTWTPRAATSSRASSTSTPTPPWGGRQRRQTGGHAHYVPVLRRRGSHLLVPPPP